MKKTYLLPSRFKKIGWTLFLPTAVLFALVISGVIDDEAISFTTPVVSLGGFFEGSPGLHLQKEGMLAEIAIVLLSISLLFISFAKEKDEDEMISNIRMQSFVWAIKINTAILIIGTWITFGTLYIYFILVWIFLVFLLYIGKFNYELYRLRRGSNEE